MNIPENVGSKYRFIILSGQRVAQLQKGAKPRLENAEKMKMTQIATMEMEAEKLEFKKIGDSSEHTMPEIQLKPPIEQTLDKASE